MKLMGTAEFMQTFFSDGSRPGKVTLLRWLDNGDIPGMKIGGKWYIDIDAMKSIQSKNPLVNMVLRAS